jgi:hypothetical protein
MAMTCVYEEKQYSRNGEDVRRAYILADETPATMPLTGENIDRLPDTVVLDTGSVLKDLATGKKHVLYDDEWHEDE